MFELEVYWPFVVSVEQELRLTVRERQFAVAVQTRCRKPIIYSRSTLWTIHSCLLPGRR
jgi:hypothetical protein